MPTNDDIYSFIDGQNVKHTKHFLQKGYKRSEQNYNAESQRQKLSYSSLTKAMEVSPNLAR
jgi:hypothetical protein